MEDEEILPRLEVEELLERYAAGERNFERVDLSGADLSGVDFGERMLKRIYYNRPINFSFSNLSNANLSSANLSWASMECVNLSGANLSGANLYCACLGGANLKGANLSNSKLISADLAGADLTNANLSGATELFNSKDTIFHNTILPDGTVINEKG
ncbi:pentapeptide repeat-containing protein [Tolypothrix bouteillei VB521301_2]|uniref:pentapeptide repeat-containing protein n=1 Tax=Tolypothrix bouteillei TaxID=1246981 RepID=UPI00067905DC